MHKTNYPTNLTDKQWQVIEKILDDKKRKRKHSLRNIFNAIMYILKTGCQWRMLPIDFPQWELVYYYFSRWKYDGTLEEMNEILRNMLRKQKGKPVSPSVGLIDSQSIKTTRVGGEERGYDGNKKIKGRKRHIITDTNGWLLSVVINAANKHDSQTGFEVMDTLKYRFERMQKIYADGGYRGELVDEVKNQLGWELEIVLRSDKNAGFKPLPKRWIIERTFSWLENFRRLAKDYEYTVSSSTAMIFLAFIALALNNIF
jgi:putative transposase